VSLLAFVALLVLCLLLGRALEPWWTGEPSHPESRLVLALVAGWVLGNAVLLVLSACGIRWSWWSIGLPLLALVAFARWRFRLQRPTRSAPVAAARLSWQLGWGDAIAALALGSLGWFAARGELLFPDFVYHWGTKAQKFALAGGVDWEYLARPWLAQLHHPEYPLLLPNLGALTALSGGGFDARAAGLWSIVALVAVVLAVRGALRAAGAAPFVVQATTAWTGAALAMFGINYALAGSADPFPALALAVALPALLKPAAVAGRVDDAQVGLAAALAAAAKIEGVVLAALLVAVQIARRSRAGHRPAWGAAARAGLPVALVVLPWLYGCWRYELRSTAAGSLDLGQLPLVAEFLGRQLFLPAWFGMAVLLLLLPLLLVSRELRALGMVVAGQLGFYVYTYLSAPFEPGYYILSTFPRLVLHLLPAVVAGAMVGLVSRRRRRAVADDF
jgi:hypothetical protein